jgi:hypothetical protein
VRWVTKLGAVFLLAFIAAGCNKNAPPTLDATEASIACAANLEHIDTAKKSWARKQGSSATDAPTADDLDPFFRRGMPKCPSGGTYTIGPVGEMPQCSIAAHNDYFKAHPPEPPPQ